MNKLNFLLALSIFACMPQADVAKSILPRTKGVNNQDIHKIFSAHDLVGVYNEISHVFEITFKENIDYVDIIIYKNGVVCENDADQNIQKDDFKNYLLSKYGTGEYTIYIKINDNIEIIRSFKW